MSSAEYQRTWRAQNPDKVRAYYKAGRERVRAWNKANHGHTASYMRDRHMRKKYGISWREREAIAWSQGYRCLCCGAQAELTVDHCHRTNMVRGLLCHLCNLMIGSAHDRGDILIAAAEYLGAA